MKLSLTLLSCILLAGCGAVYVGGYYDGVATGNVSLVRLTSALDEYGNSVQVTVVTLQELNDRQDLTLCGSHSSDFPLGARVTAKYKSGPVCSTLVSLTIDK